MTVTQMMHEKPFRMIPHGYASTDDCTCGYQVVKYPGGATPPHADDCPTRIRRAAAKSDDDVRYQTALRQWERERPAREAIAEAEQAAHEMACGAHSWFMLSHEERQCRRCGAIEFVPDV